MKQQILQKMRYKGYKIFLLFLLFLGKAYTTNAQVYGGYFYLTYDKGNYEIIAYGIDNDSLANNKKITLDNKEIRGIIYDKINFISFQNDKSNAKLKGKQFYETIVLKVIEKGKKNDAMLIFITGRFDDRLNYELNIEFKTGVYTVFIPISEKLQFELDNSYIARGCKNITKLLSEM